MLSRSLAFFLSPWKHHLSHTLVGQHRWNQNVKFLNQNHLSGQWSAPFLAENNFQFLLIKEYIFCLFVLMLLVREPIFLAAPSLSTLLLNFDCVGKTGWLLTSVSSGQHHNNMLLQQSYTSCHSIPLPPLVFPSLIKIHCSFFPICSEGLSGSAVFLLLESSRNWGVNALYSEQKPQNWGRSALIQSIPWQNLLLVLSAPS